MEYEYSTEPYKEPVFRKIVQFTYSEKISEFLLVVLELYKGWIGEREVLASVQVDTSGAIFTNYWVYQEKLNLYFIIRDGEYDDDFIKEEILFEQFKTFDRPTQALFTELIFKYAQVFLFSEEKEKHKVLGSLVEDKYGELHVSYHHLHLKIKKDVPRQLKML